MTQWRRSLAWLGVTTLVLVLLGCHRNGTSSSSAQPGGSPGEQDPSGPGGDSQEFAAGRKVFEANNCARCHMIRGRAVGGPPPGGPPPGGPGPGGGMRGGRGPDLGMVGKDPSHTVDWLMEHVRNPKTHKPNSNMPAFEGKIKAEDLRALAEYLASLK